MSGADALTLARKGFYVFPVDHPSLPYCHGIRTKDHDPATCTDRGKHPCVKFSVEASTDRGKVEHAWQGRTRNIGIACAQSKLIVVDEDELGGFTRCAESLGETIPDTYIVVTGRPGGGRHYYFRAPPDVVIGNSAGGLKPFGCDVRGGKGKGGYVVGAGSTHASGATYTAENDLDPAPCPEWLIAALQRRTADASSDEGEASHVGPIPKGERDSRLFDYAVWLRQNHDGTLTIDEAHTLMAARWEHCVQPPHAPDFYPLASALGKVDNVWRDYQAGPSVIGETAPPKQQPASEPFRRVRLTSAATIAPKPVRWVWTDRVPVGEVTLTPGRGGVGKSTFHAWMIAQLTRGELPGVHFGQCKPAIIAASEDSWQRTIVPRLIAANADRSIVFRADVVVSGDQELMLSLPLDGDELEAQIVAAGAVVLSVDPLISTLAGSIDTYRDREVRSALEPLSRIADRTGCAVLGNAHFKKGASDPLESIMASAAFGNVARAALAFALDPEAEDHSCVISQAKNNLGRLDLPSLSYRIESATIDTDDGPAEVGKLVMLGESDRSVHDILRDGGTDEDDRSERDEAAEWLIKYLDDHQGEAIASDAIKAARRDGIAERTLQRARRRAGVTSSKPTFGGPWVWRAGVTVISTEGAGTEGASSEGATKAPKAPASENVAPSAPSAAPWEEPGSYREWADDTANRALPECRQCHRSQPQWVLDDHDGMCIDCHRRGRS